MVNGKPERVRTMTDDPLTRRQSLVNSDLLTGIWNGLMIEGLVLFGLFVMALLVLR